MPGTPDTSKINEAQDDAPMFMGTWQDTERDSGRTEPADFSDVCASQRRIGLKIAQLAPLWESVPPKTYGGTELVVHLLTETLVGLGHEVTLFASGDSQTQGRLISTVPASLRTQGVQVATYEELSFLEAVFERAEEFDIIHNHMMPMPLPFARMSQTPVLTTLHGAFKPKALREFIEQYAELPYVSISNYQRTGSPHLNYMATVYHGLDLQRFDYDTQGAHKDYLVFLGRFSAEKGPHLAIQIARETGLPLVMAGKVDLVDREYFLDDIEPCIDGQLVRYIGEVNHAQKVTLLKNAKATLCPVLWPEPFGLVLIESMACGTPVIALRDGSIPEIVESGINGFICQTVDEMIDAVHRISEINRRRCRLTCEQRFTKERMTLDYQEIYRLLVEQSQANRYHKHHPPGLVSVGSLGTRS
jgi:glycosyltransferase involved in cell wall biosynthesis